MGRKRTTLFIMVLKVKSRRQISEGKKMSFEVTILRHSELVYKEKFFSNKTGYEFTI